MRYPIKRDEKVSENTSLATFLLHSLEFHHRPAG